MTTLHTEAPPIRQHWPYRWLNRPTGAHGLAETLAPMTQDEFELYLFRLISTGGGQWHYEYAPEWKDLCP